MIDEEPGKIEKTSKPAYYRNQVEGFQDKINHNDTHDNKDNNKDDNKKYFINQKMSSHIKKIKVGVVGGRGYTGAECLRLLNIHPHVELSAVFSTSRAGKLIGDEFPTLKIDNPGVARSKFVSFTQDNYQDCELLFLAAPNAIAMDMVPQLLKQNIRVIDLSADFRLRSQQKWEKYYQQKHTSFNLVKEAVYGLSEYERPNLRNAHLVANPGCYPTSIALPLIPLLLSNLINQENIIVDAKSGVSGAGRHPEYRYLFAELQNNFLAYGLPSHRHQPEIEQILSTYSKANATLCFVPHLLPISRGILSTIYLNGDSDIEQIHSTLTKRYKDETFIHILPIQQLPEISYVSGTNYCAIGVSQHMKGNIILVSVIDNLLKGAAGQAVQNMNIMYGWDETTSLLNSVAQP